MTDLPANVPQHERINIAAKKAQFKKGEMHGKAAPNAKKTGKKSPALKKMLKKKGKLK